MNKAQKLLLIIEGWGNRIFTPKYNPFYYLGAIALFLMWVLLFTGLYLFLFYEISVEGAYKSVQYITEGQRFYGGIIRSLHRYTADGLILAMLLHTLREFILGRYKNGRWVAWVSGVSILLFTWFSGVIGYWLVWDERAQAIAIITSEIVDFIPILSEPLSLAFMNNSTVTNLFFFVILFLHIVIPVLLFLGIWIHYFRISRPVINPYRWVSAAIVFVLLILSVLKPVSSAPAADLHKIIPSVPIDWFFLFLYPLMAAIPSWASLITIISFSALFISIPWITKLDGAKPSRKKAEIVPEDCVGCTLCYMDCPYEAVYMKSKGDKPVAEVVPSRCVSCGICIGSCSFNAVNMGQWTDKGIKENISRLLSPSSPPPLLKGGTGGLPNILGFVCEKSVRVDGLLDSGTTIKGIPNVKILSLPCIGIIHPSIIEYSLDSGAEGVIICGCKIGDCNYREGNIWLQSRLSGERDPSLKSEIRRPIHRIGAPKSEISKVRTCWLSASETEKFVEEVNLFNTELREGHIKPSPVKPALTIPAFLSLLLPAVLVLIFSSLSYPFFKSDKAMLKIGFKHTSPKIHDCTDEEVRAYQEKMRMGLIHMTKKKGEEKDCGKRERFPVYLELYIDDVKILSETYKPTGLRKDGAVFYYNKFIVEPGSRTISIKMRDSEKEGEFNYTFKEEIELKTSHVVSIDFDRRKKMFFKREG
ncbi:MAG: cytochrome b N-terminal domain-containing protein [Nitrospinae bacterium]|nr:cytochrome b N-terminal domain-containing protein [Nitrospinota bacterium]